MNEKPLTLRVACYAGYRGDEEPRCLWLGESMVEIVEIVDRWLAPDHRYFKIKGNDGGTYIIRHDEITGVWELILFDSSASTDHDCHTKPHNGSH